MKFWLSLEICYETARVGDIKDSYADIDKARSLLGYESTVSLKDGLQDLSEKVRYCLRK